MTNFATAMKQEVVRLARKELRTELEGLKNASTQHRKEIADLKREVGALKKLLALVAGRAAKKAAEQTDETEAPAKRFSAKGFATHREKLGLSAEETGLLVEVSPQTVYGWEKGRKPQERHTEAIAAFRRMGKREARARLEKLTK